MLSKFMIVGALGAIAAAAAPAQAEDAKAKQRFTHEGYTYVYDIKDTKTGQVISGKRFPDAVAFNLSVKHGRVVGQSGGQNVAFKIEDARGASAE